MTEKEKTVKTLQKEFMKSIRQILILALMLTLSFAAFGCGDFGSTDTVRITENGNYSVQGTVATDNGLSAQGAVVTFLQNGAAVAVTQTDEKGNYRVCLNTGTYLMNVSLPGYELWQETVAVNNATVKNNAALFAACARLRPQRNL